MKREVERMSRLQANELTIGYGEQLIMERLDVVIPDRSVTTIIGPNGCGKSTLLKALTRLLAPGSGAVYLDGADLARLNTKDIAKKMAILTQIPEGVEGLRVFDLVSYGRFPYQSGFGRLSKRDREAIEWALEVTGTAIYRHRLVDELSGGQRQRVWIALALAQETDIIFLDEPTTYLDLAHQLEVLELLEQLNRTQDRTIVMVLHDINQAARFADHIIAMRDGRIVRSGPPEEVITSEVLRDVFYIDAFVGTDPRTKKPMCVTYSLVEGER